MQTAKVVKGLHVLYKGGNGKNTHGITVHTLNVTVGRDRDGMKTEWDVNDHTILHSTYERLGVSFGLTRPEYEALVAEVQLVVDSR